MERLVVINREFTCHLVRVITPYIFQSIEKLYRSATEVYNKLDKNPSQDGKPAQSALKIFQNLLRSALNWNAELITRETERIRRESGTTKYFDKLVQATIKSYVLLLTDSRQMSSGRFQPIGSLSEFHKTIKIDAFVHNCYIEACKLIYNNPRIFLDDGVAPINVIENRTRAYKDIGRAIEEAIRRTIPMNDITAQYLRDDLDDMPGPIPGAAPPVPYPVQQQVSPLIQDQYIQNSQYVQNSQQPQYGQNPQQFQNLQQQFTQQPQMVSSGQGVQIQLGQSGQAGQAVTVMTDPNGMGGVTIQTGDAQQQDNQQPIERARPGGPKPVRPTLSFLLSRGKNTEEVKRMLDPEGVESQVDPDHSQDRHEVAGLLDMASVVDRPPMAMADSISFNVPDGDVRKMTGGASHHSKGGDSKAKKR
jgi:hypothetical protein